MADLKTTIGVGVFAPCRIMRRQGVSYDEPDSALTLQKVPGYLPPSISRFCPVMKLAWTLHR